MVGADDDLARVRAAVAAKRSTPSLEGALEGAEDATGLLERAHGAPAFHAPWPDERPSMRG